MDPTATATLTLGKVACERKGTSCGLRGFRAACPQAFTTRSRYGRVSCASCFPPTRRGRSAHPLSLRSSPRPAGRPWLMVNMVASVDGAIAIDGVSGGLGGDGDSMAFRAIRASCDWIVAAAGTIRAERYRIPRATEETAAVRRRRPERSTPTCGVSASVDLDPELPLFADQRDGEARPLVITGANPPADRMHALEGRAEWHHTDTERPTAEVCSLRSGNEVRTSCSPKAARRSTASSSTAASSTNSAFDLTPPGGRRFEPHRQRERSHDPCRSAAGSPARTRQRLFARYVRA